MPVPDRRQPPPRIQIERVTPSVDGGRYPAKAGAGGEVRVTADVFRDGHEVLRAVVRAQGPGEKDWTEYPLAPTDHDVGGNGYAGSFPVDRQGRWRFRIEAWADAFASWTTEMTRKLAAGESDLSGELSEGRLLVERAAARAKSADKKLLAAALETWGVEAATNAPLAAAMARVPDRSAGTRTPNPLEVEVDRQRATFGSWYELFPRSWGGLEGVASLAPHLAELGFDVIYLPPIHPIGVKNRKGPNNTMTPGPGDPGSPWAIGLLGTGGHDAIHPDLGTEADFDALVAACADANIEIAMDYAIQCSADHPWLTEHPDWFQQRPDGTLKYAENPPKKYQDIYNVDWDCEDWRGLWQALLDVALHWVRKGVRIFRVDNPHTKPLPFWEWLIAEIRAEEPDVVFLAEAFTKAAMMRTLGKVGFSQSYTYFAWKYHREELIEYVVELAYSGMADYYRPNFWPNTPDILTEQLQTGGPPAFHARLVLAATLSPSYGIYSGYERFENVPVKPGSEEYLDSEKFEARERRLDGPLLPVIRRLNLFRRAHPALQRLDNVRFVGTDSDQLIGYVKKTGADAVLTIVNMDPHNVQEGVFDVPVEAELPDRFGVRDALSGAEFEWGLGRNYVRLAPGAAHVMELTA